MHNNINDIRFIHLPPMICATVRCISVSPETDSLDEVYKLISDYYLIKIKPDIRHFGFTPKFDNNGNQNIGAYERWITVPDDLNLPEPFTKKKFEGGLYAARMVPIGHFDEVTQIIQHLKARNEFELILGDEDSLLEEYLDVTLLIQKDTDFFRESQIDLLVKIKDYSRVIEN